MTLFWLMLWFICIVLSSLLTSHMCIFFLYIYIINSWRPTVAYSHLPSNTLTKTPSNLRKVKYCICIPEKWQVSQVCKHSTQFCPILPVCSCPQVQLLGLWSTFILLFVHPSGTKLQWKFLHHNIQLLASERTLIKWYNLTSVKNNCGYFYYKLQKIQH
jgi:hypothetical protein